MSTNKLGYVHLVMNSHIITLGICCQLAISLQYMARFFEKPVTLTLRIRCLIAALFYGVMGILLLYGWLSVGLTLPK